MNQKIFADLHNHTTDSDGDFSAQELIKLAKSLEIKAVGVTNHDTINGLKSVIEAGEQYEIDVVPGVEISIRFKETLFTGTLHLLAYFKPERLKDADFVKKMQEGLAQGRGEKLVRARVEEINRVFGPDGTTPVLKRDMRFEDISQLSQNASRRHFALALNQTFGIEDPARVNAVIGNDSPAYLPSGIDFDAAMDLVKELDLFTALAHPAAGSFPGEGHYKEVLPPVEIVKRFLPRFLQGGLEGIEVYYPGHTKAHQEMMNSWAKAHHLVVTGGSDTHDAVNRPLGVAGLDETLFKKFKTNLR